ncbi:probable serine/threonine-protein kinase SIS8 isoform X1 [Dendrobium catenatum]|uniref:probable serine/threonine-protein kinase SIS8 isoform X1 n=1 Tax=Dendrobium catenatum TaxID=906689 RepID=UPI0009F454D3|nr:probable serine/threonine-protein kinase SIS8 isoform X1 [Dendrobium catenatum]
MPRMKHLLRKLHIGGGGGLEHQHPHQHRLDEPRMETPPPPTMVQPASSPSLSMSSTLVSPSVDGAESRSSGSRSEAASTPVGAGGSDFSLLEEEYQVQLALAISASGPHGTDDIDSVQIKAAKQMSLDTAAATAGGGGCTESNMELLSLRYWSYNVVNYDEKLTDGFYDVYGIISDHDRKMPSLVDLQATSVSEILEYEVVLLDRTVDCALQHLEKRALLIASECRAIENGPIASCLVQKIAHLVAEYMGGRVEDAEDMLRRWKIRSNELRTSLNTIVLPLGLLGVGLSRHRALLFKVLADRIDLPCKLVKGSHYTGTDEGAINLIKVDYESEYIIDLMGAPGTLIPAEVPSSHLHNSGTILHCTDTIEQSVKDLCLALDKVSCQFEKKSDVSEENTSDNNSILGTVGLPSQEKSEHLCEGDYIRVERKSLIEGCGQENETVTQTTSGVQRVISPVEQMKVNDVSKYVVTAAKNPEFARKLHAVLLESGASPPLDLFSNLNTVHGLVDQGIPTNSISVEGSLGREEGKEEQSPSSSANPVVGRNPSPFLKTNQGSILDSSQFKGYLVADEANRSHLVSVSNAKKSAQYSEAKEEGSNNDLHLSSGSEKESFKPLLDGVAEWEIPWEDLQIGERIGLGSYGEVYRADWNGTDVAVKKFLDQDLSGDALELFRFEVRIMLRLRHPNVVLFMGAVTRPPNLSILTEFLPRGSLYRLLHRHNVKLEEKRRMKMALDVAKGMNYLHTSHPTIVHRDLKSPNLLVDRNWVVKVCDFGLSRLKHHTFLSSKSTAGTPEWMAPEVLRNEPSNEKCDVYSFGVILWELATMCMPWSGMNPMQVVGAVGYQNKRLDIPQEVDPLVSKIITDCWESDPNLRPSFAQLLPHLKQLQKLIVPMS